MVLAVVAGGYTVLVSLSTQLHASWTHNARGHSLFRAVSSVITDGNIIHAHRSAKGACGMSRVCVDRCVQDPQQVVTRNHEGCGTAGGYPSVKSFVCPRERHCRWSVWPVCPSSLKKIGPFFLFTLATVGTIPIHHGKPRSILVAVVSHRVSTAETMASLIKISFCKWERFLSLSSSRAFSIFLVYSFQRSVSFKRNNMILRDSINNACVPSTCEE